MYRNDTDTDTGDKVSFRLPRLGCFSLFFIFFILGITLSVFLISSSRKTPPSFEIPSAKVSVYDPDEILQENVRGELESLAQELSDAAHCSVAVMLVDDKEAGFGDIFHTIAGEWNPEHGVLLLMATRTPNICLALLGGEWRLADWDSKALDKNLAPFNRRTRRGEICTTLLRWLLYSVRQAEKTPLAAKTKKSEISVLFATSMKKTEKKASPAAVALGVSVFALLIGWLILRNGKKQRALCLVRNPEVQQSYEEKVRENPALRLEDLNEYRKADRRTHRKGWKICAIVLGFLFGVLSPDPALMPPEPDYLPMPVEITRTKSRVIDRAAVFSEEGLRMLEETIRRMEKDTGGEMMVVTVPSLDGRSLEEYSLETASALKIGKAGKDNGALLFFAMKEKKTRLEIGYGWEGPVNDGRAGALLRSIIPDLRDGKFADGAAKVVQGVAKYVLEAEGRSAEGGEKIKAAPLPVIRIFDAGAVQIPEHADPRKLSDEGGDGFLWALLAVVCCLAGAGMGYRGRLYMTSVPHLVLFDPTIVRHHNSSSGSDDYDSDSSSSSDDDDDSGGGSFGGGGASSGW